MPRLSQIMIRTALVWLGIGSTVGGLLLVQKGVPFYSWLWSLRSAHIHMLLVGWTVQLACGVAFWILPRLNAAGSRGDERLAWGSYAALNSGVVLGALVSLVSSAGGMGRALHWQSLLAVTGLLYLVGAALFAVHAWPRIVRFRILAAPGAITPQQDEQSLP